MDDLCDKGLMGLHDGDKDIIQHIVDEDIVESGFGVFGGEVDVVLILTVERISQLGFGEFPCFLDGE